MPTWDEWRGFFAPRDAWRVVPGPSLRGDALASGLPCAQTVLGLAWSADGRRVAVASGGSIDGADGLVRVAEPDTGRTWLLHGHVGGTHAVAFDPRTGRLATVGHDGAFGLWDLDEGEGLSTRGPHPRHRVVFARGGDLLIIGDELPDRGGRSSVTVIDATAPRMLGEHPLPADTLVEGLVASPDGDRVLLHLFHRFGAHHLECRTLPGWDLVWSAEGDPTDYVNGLAWPLADTIVRSVSDDGRQRHLQHLDPATGTVRGHRVVGRTMLGGIDCDAVRGRIATIGNEGRLAVWDLSSLEPLGAGDLGDWPATRVALSPDGQRVAVGSAKEDGVWILTLPGSPP